MAVAAPHCHPVQGHFTLLGLVLQAVCHFVKRLVADAVVVAWLTVRFFGYLKYKFTVKHFDTKGLHFELTLFLFGRRYNAKTQGNFT